ncbi:MAG TPA: hypothetical protein ENJ87_06760, partial [Gammaproteobacteria bacterium]|nr:hypothetical protein [Gammaproteobacteria bacterium]
IGHNISNAAVYTDFNALSRLKADAAQQSGPGKDIEKSEETNKKVSGQIEAMFFQMVLKSMRDAQSVGDSPESDQTRFYQDMFDKQITLELSQNNGNGTGLATMIERQISGVDRTRIPDGPATENIELIRNQINRSLNLNGQSDDRE